MQPAQEVGRLLTQEEAPSAALANGDDSGQLPAARRVIFPTAKSPRTGTRASPSAPVSTGARRAGGSDFAPSAPAGDDASGAAGGGAAKSPVSGAQPSLWDVMAMQDVVNSDDDAFDAEAIEEEPAPAIPPSNAVVAALQNLGVRHTLCWTPTLLQGPAFNVHAVENIVRAIQNPADRLPHFTEGGGESRLAFEIASHIDSGADATIDPTMLGRWVKTEEVAEIIRWVREFENGSAANDGVISPS